MLRSTLYASIPVATTALGLAVDLKAYFFIPLTAPLFVYCFIHAKHSSDAEYEIDHFLDEQ